MPNLLGEWSQCNPMLRDNLYPLKPDSLLEGHVSEFIESDTIRPKLCSDFMTHRVRLGHNRIWIMS